MTSQKKIGALLGYANILVKNLVNLIYVPLLLHYLGQGDYGVFQMTNSVVFALTLLSAGFMAVMCVSTCESALRGVRMMG